MVSNRAHWIVFGTMVVYVVLFIFLVLKAYPNAQGLIAVGGILLVIAVAYKLAIK